jgi:hypothetical protein
MNPYAWLSAFVLLLASLAGSFYAGVKYEAGVTAISQNKGLEAFAKRIKEVMDNDDKTNALNAALHEQLTRMQHAHLPACPGAIDTSGAAGLLRAAQDAAFEELQRGDDEDFARCDILNSDATRTNALIR